MCSFITCQKLGLIVKMSSKPGQNMHILVSSIMINVCFVMIISFLR